LKRHDGSLVEGRKLRAGQKPKVKTQKANVKAGEILPFDLCDLHFDLPFDVG
jgi:hypothetical protein